VLAELRAEKERLQKQLTELEVRAKISDERFEKLEKGKQEPQKEEEQAPSAEEILQYVDGQITAVEEQLTKAETEDPSSAPQLRRQLRQLERYYIDIKNQAAQMLQQQVDPAELVNEAVTEAQYKSRFDATTSAIKQEYPMLDAASEAFNEQYKADIMEIYQPLLEKGKDPIEALTKATVLVMRANGVLSASEQAKLEQQKAEAEAPKTAKPKAKTEERKKAAVKRNVKAAQAQPPNIANTGSPNDSGKQYDFDNMSDKEFDKLVPDEDAEKAFEKALMMYDD
jgi:methanogenic corrinoid protein MtbC1